MNFRQKTAPIHELVDPNDPLKRDGPVKPDDPNKSRMQNCLSYMRTNPMYMPPNPWPEGMMLFGIDHERRMCCAFMMLIEQFEEIPEKELFGLCNENTVTLYFIPVPKMPGSNAEAQAQISKWISGMKDDEFSLTVQYLETNGWRLRKNFTTF